MYSINLTWINPDTVTLNSIKFIRGLQSNCRTFWTDWQDDDEKFIKEFLGLIKAMEKAYMFFKGVNCRFLQKIKGKK